MSSQIIALMEQGQESGTETQEIARRLSGSSVNRLTAHTRVQDLESHYWNIISWKI